MKWHTGQHCECAAPCYCAGSTSADCRCVLNECPCVVPEDEEGYCEVCRGPCQGH